MNLKPFIPLVIAMLLLAASVGLYGFAYYTLMRWETKAAALATDAATKSENIQRITKAHAALATVSSDEATLDQYAVGSADIAPFLETLQTDGRAQSAKVDVLSVTDEKDKKSGHNRIGIMLGVAGSFDAVMRTLGTIEYSPYDGVITSLTFGVDNGTASTTSSGWRATATYSVSAASSKPKP